MVLEEVRRTHGVVDCFMGALMRPVSVFLTALPLGAIFSRTHGHVAGSVRPQFLEVNRKRASWVQETESVELTAYWSEST